MTKDELSEKRNQAIKSLNDIKALLGLDELYIDELETENKELKQINSEGLTQLNLENGKLIIENENLRKENEKLRLKLEALESQTPWKDIKDKSELIKENVELKKMYHEIDEDNNKLRENIPLLAEAKEIIKTFLGFAEAFGYSPSMDKFITEAEQFISEVDK